MSGTAAVCPDCGSSNVVEDDLYSQTHMVCQDCGSVVSEGILTADRGEGSDFRYSETTAFSKKACKNQREGLCRVRSLCRILRLSPDTEELAETYYKKAYEHPCFLRVALVKKEALVGCCILISCRLRNYPIAMGTVSCLLEADPVLMGVVYQDLVKTLNVEAPGPCVSEILATHSHEYKVSSADVPEELAETHGDLAKRAMALVELAADCWLVTGRRPQPIMMAAIFLAWQSLRPTAVRLAFSLGRFCQLARVPKSHTAMKRIREMLDALCKLGREIPWLVEEVTPGTVLKVTDNILQYRFALLRVALRTQEEALLSAPPQPGEDGTGDDAGLGKMDDVPVEAAAAAAPDLGRPEGGTTAPAPAEGPAPPALAPHWSESLLFPPPCLTNKKRRRSERRKQSLPRPDVTGNEDISDSEIDSYIRTPREVREFAAMQELMSSSGAAD